jgi:hypothetical protein
LQLKVHKKMTLQKRIEILVKLGQYMQANNDNWQQAKHIATTKNGWFIPQFIDNAVQTICEAYLQQPKLEAFANQYNLQTIVTPKTIGIVMAGNIPLVGFHDFLCVFLSGNYAKIKLSEKDDVLLKHLIQQLINWDSDCAPYVEIAPMLKNCDAYIATGSNNSARYFEQYFGKYPNIIRKNKTSVAVLTGNETAQQLADLATDVHLYFGLGCRNVTKIYVPQAYDFVPILNAFRSYNYLADNHKFKNNYDYNLAIHILNNVFYMTNDSVLLIEDERLFSPISQLHYTYYNTVEALDVELQQNIDIQCIVGQQYIPFGQAQQPTINQFADGVDTMLFLTNLS